MTGRAVVCWGLADGLGCTFDGDASGRVRAKPVCAGARSTPQAKQLSSRVRQAVIAAQLQDHAIH